MNDNASLKFFDILIRQFLINIYIEYIAYVKVTLTFYWKNFFLKFYVSEHVTDQFLLKTIFFAKPSKMPEKSWRQLRRTYCTYIFLTSQYASLFYLTGYKFFKLNISFIENILAFDIILVLQ